MDSILTLRQIGEWLHAKQKALAASPVSITEVQERPEFVPAVMAEFSGRDAVGRIDGWVSGEFDFEVVRVSDGTDLFQRHIVVSALDELDIAYEEFLRYLTPVDADQHC